jgi:hypothetical protein
MKTLIENRVLDLTLRRNEALVEYEDAKMNNRHVLSQEITCINSELKFLNELSQAAVSGSLQHRHEWIWNHATGHHYCKCGAQAQ